LVTFAAVVLSATGSNFVELIPVLSLANESSVCWREPTYRGLGHFGNCTADEEKELGLCYQKCGADEEGVGPVCWKDCPADRSLVAGPFCCEDSASCIHDAVGIARLTMDVGRVIADAQAAPYKLIHDLRKLFEDEKGLRIPEC